MLGGIQPDLVPVATLREMPRDDVDHVFGRVGIVGTRSSIARKVILDRLTVVANITKVHRFATLGQQQESVELGEQLGRGLVNGHQHRLADISQLAQEPNCVVGGLAIQT